MKKMRLFEVGFKYDRFDTSYSHKFYVAADTGEEAIKKGRAWLVEDHLSWWEEEGQEAEMAEILDDEIDEWVDGETDKWVTKRFAESPPLRATLKQRLDNVLSDFTDMPLARLYDTGTLVI